MKNFFLFLGFVLSVTILKAAPDRTFVGDANADGKDDIIYVNTDYAGGAIRIVNPVTGQDIISWVNHGNFNGWMDPTDKMFLGDVDNDGGMDLVLVNTNYVGGAIRVIGGFKWGNGYELISWLNHTAISSSGWMDANDKMFLGDVNADGRQDLVLVNTDYSAGAIRAINLVAGGGLASGVNIAPTIGHISNGYGKFATWMDLDDRMFLGDVNGDGKKDLILVNTSYVGPAVRAIDVTTGNILSDNNTGLPYYENSTWKYEKKQINNGSLYGWLDKADWIDVKDVNNDNKEDLVFVNTQTSTGGLIRAISITSCTDVAPAINFNSTYTGFLEPCNRWFIADANGDNYKDLIMVNTASATIRAVSIMNGSNVASISNDGSFGGWIDNADKLFMVKTAVGSRDDLMFLTSETGAGVGQIRVIRLNTSSYTALYWWDYAQLGSNLVGWKDGWAYTCVGRNNPANFSNPFVYMQNNSFYSYGSPFYPKVQNFSVNLVKEVNQTFSQSMVFPEHGHSPNNLFCCTTQVAADVELRAQLKKIADMGFNTIRLCGLQVASSNDINTTPFIARGIDLALNNYSTDDLTNTVNQDKLFSHIQRVLDAAKDNGLKVMLLVADRYALRNDIYASKYVPYLRRLANYFKNNTTLIAYDIYNEPKWMYDLPNYNIYTKTLACDIVRSCNDAIKEFDINHPTTIGLWGDYDIGVWDPSLMDVDFLSFHLYPTVSKAIANTYQGEINTYFKWVSNTITKPWIIGETGYSGINRSPNYNPDNCETTNNITNGWGTEQNQLEFTNLTYDKTRNCGGIGYSFWYFHDIYGDGLPVSENYEGLISRCNRVKPAGLAFLKDGYDVPCCTCPQPSDADYYSRNTNLPYNVNGLVVTQNLYTGIEDAVVAGIPANPNQPSEPWIWTKTNSSGFFSINSSYPIKEIWITALGFSTVKYVYNPNIPSAPNTYNSPYGIPATFLSPVSCSALRASIAPNSSMNSLYYGKINFFPNPSTGIINIESGVENYNVKVFEVTGKLVIENFVTSYNKQLDLSGLGNGIYFISVEKDEQLLLMEKVVLNK